MESAVFTFFETNKNFEIFFKKIEKVLAFYLELCYYKRVAGERQKVSESETVSL